MDYGPTNGLTKIDCRVLSFRFGYGRMRSCCFDVFTIECFEREAYV